MLVNRVLKSMAIASIAWLTAGSPKGLLVVANSGEDTVALVNPAHPLPFDKVVTHQHPQDVVTSPDGSFAYVAEMGTTEAVGDTVGVIDLRSRKMVKRFNLGRATLPHLLVLSRDGHTLWVACAPENAIVELDTTSGVIRKVWDTQQKGSYLLAVTPDEKKLYVANFDAGSVSVIQRYDASVQILQIGGQPIGIDVSPNGREVWVSNFKTDAIAVIDAASDRVVQIFPAGGEGPARLKFTPDAKYVWVTCSRSNDLVVLDAGQHRMIRRIPTGRFSKGLLVLPDGKHAFVSAVDDNVVFEVDVAEGHVLRRLSVGAAPEGLAWVARP
jgi:DNA-binding beta-propeller fold protein YncE